MDGGFCVLGLSRYSHAKMAKRRSANTTVLNQPSRAMRKHVESFGGVRRYDEWCRKNGLRLGLDKSANELSAEQALLSQQQLRLSEQAKLHRNPKKLIAGLCSGTISAGDIDRPFWKILADEIEKSPSDEDSRSTLLALLLHVHTVADFLEGETEFAGHTYHYVQALVRLNERRGQWIRPLDQWTPESHNPSKQFASLARHLVAAYPLPLFMDQAWFRSGRNSRRFRDWYIHVARGKNIRTAKTPVPLTKLEAHHMMLAPDNYSIEGAIRWGQIHALGGDKMLTDAIVGTRLGNGFENDDFWRSVLRFFVNNPLLDRSHVGPIIDFLRAQKFEEREVIGHDGRLRVDPPPQPNLSMKGRNAEALLAQVDNWHGTLRRHSSNQSLTFPGSGFKGLEMEVGRKGESRWVVRELLSSKQLSDEGEAMRHCVASYARSCAKGYCSIWSMQLHTPAGIESRQTIEVTKSGQIVQCRGKFNELPSHKEFQALKAWADHSRLEISPFVRMKES